jgi:hypothetical protein
MESRARWWFFLQDSKFNTFNHWLGKQFQIPIGYDGDQVPRIGLDVMVKRKISFPKLNLSCPTCSQSLY